VIVAPGAPATRKAASPPLWFRAGVVALFLFACFYGALEVHYSTDTWIGLAAGRQIMTEPTFP